MQTRSVKEPHPLQAQTPSSMAEEGASTFPAPLSSPLSSPLSPEWERGPGGQGSSTSPLSLQSEKGPGGQGSSTSPLSLQSEKGPGGQGSSASPLSPEWERGPGGEGASPAIRTLNLVKQYKTTIALASLSMVVGRGEIFGFLGPNGAGKTTAVKLLLGLTRPTAGEAWVLDAPAGHRETRRRIGYLPELFRYQDWLKAREVLALHCELARLPKPQHASEIDEALEIVGLSKRAHDRVGTFSKGMQQRLGLGVALLGRPDLIFLDEPTSALDPVGRHDVREIVRGLKRRGATVFLNSHLLSEVEQVCDRVAIVDKGRVVAHGLMQEVIGGAAAVRLRLSNVTVVGFATLSQYGRVEVEADWYTVHGIEETSVPALVTDLVQTGVFIHAVQPRHHTLEDRFLQLLQKPSDSPSD